MSDKATKTYKTADYSVFEETRVALAKTENEVCDALGYGADAWRAWKANGKIPKVAAVACEGVRRRSGLSDRVYVLRVHTKAQEDALTAVAKGLGLELATV